MHRAAGSTTQGQGSSGPSKGKELGLCRALKENTMFAFNVRLVFIRRGYREQVNSVVCVVMSLTITGLMNINEHGVIMRPWQSVCTASSYGATTRGQGSRSPSGAKERGLSAVVPVPVSFYMHAVFFGKNWSNNSSAPCPSEFC